MLEGAGTNYKGPLAFDLGLKDLRHISLGRDKKTFQKRKNIRKDDKPYVCVCVCVYVYIYIYIHGLKIQFSRSLYPTTSFLLHSQNIFF